MTPRQDVALQAVVLAADVVFVVGVIALWRWTRRDRQTVKEWKR